MGTNPRLNPMRPLDRQYICLARNRMGGWDYLGDGPMGTTKECAEAVEGHREWRVIDATLAPDATAFVESWIDADRLVAEYETEAQPALERSCEGR